MRRVLIVGVVLVTALLLPLAAAARTPATYTSPDCLHLQIRPTEIVFACGDGTYYVNHLSWRSWHKSRATGLGVFHQNDCQPNCATGTFHQRRGRLVLRNRTWCSGLHKYAFKGAYVRYNSPLLGELETTFRILLPLRC